MHDRPTYRTCWSDRLAFLGQFVRRPREVASIVPSTRFVERRIARCVADFPGTVVELGAGTGGVTKAILASISSTARLVAVELNPVLAARVARLRDPRLSVHCGSAEDLPEILRAHGCVTASAIVSGLPFSTIPHVRATRILDGIDRSLASGGAFVAYHVRKTLKRLVDARNGPPCLELLDESFEWRSIPPLWVYRWRKVADPMPRLRHATSPQTSLAPSVDSAVPV